MSQRYVDESDEFFIDEEKPSVASTLRQDNDLFDDSSYVKQQVIGVKRVPLPDGTEDWHILVDKAPAITLKGSRFTKREREFLRSSPGMSFMISGYKQGWGSVSEYKRQVAKCLKK